MAERKVLNKYYPPDFNPDSLPKYHKKKRIRQLVIRIMAPMSMKCDNCGEYIYKGKKFNARQETVQNEDYLGLKIYRFYIKCPRCMSELTFKTDPKNADYQMELGGKRCFDAAKLAAKKLEKEQELHEEEEKINPMQALEKRTKDSRKEMEALEKLEEIQDLNMRYKNVDFEKMLELHNELHKEEEFDVSKQEELDDDLARKTFKELVKPPVELKIDDFSNEFTNFNKGPKMKTTAMNAKPVVILKRPGTSSGQHIPEKKVALAGSLSLLNAYESASSE